MVTRTQTAEGASPWVEYTGEGGMPRPLILESQIEIASYNGHRNSGSAGDFDWSVIRRYRLLPKEFQIKAPVEAFDVSAVDPFPKQERYKDAGGEDWIDEFARTKSVEEFRGAMSFSIGKYNRRLGKKDDVVKEVGKMADYSQRWLQYERKLAEEE